MSSPGSRMREPTHLSCQLPRIHVLVLMGLVLFGCGGARESTGPRLVQPGAPGQPTREVSAERASAAGQIDVTSADVRFMQGMIAHHAQALTMSRLAPGRAEREDVRLLAQRIERSQGDEIALMERWLMVRGQEVPDARLGYRLPSSGEMLMMPGMLSEAELDELQAASGAEFDRLFLVYMIRHHEGALTMVRELFETEGAGEEGQIFEFAVDVDSDQRIEIARMIRMLTETR